MFLFIDDNEEMRSGGFTAVHGGEEMRKERRKVVRVCICRFFRLRAITTLLLIKKEKEN